jgi:16S rRNA C967 or C1407 C5-methylase (RsmB/RsmF family)
LDIQKNTYRLVKKHVFSTMASSHKGNNIKATPTQKGDEPMATPTVTFDPIKYKETTKQQWQVAAGAWHEWGSTLASWLDPATELMLDMAGVKEGSRVLDVAAGAGEQTLLAAKRAGQKGFVLATDISSNILEYAAQDARKAGFKNVETRVVDGEKLDELVPDSFDAVISRVGLIYFPDQQKALQGMQIGRAHV